MKYYVEVRKFAFTIERFRHLMLRPHMHTQLELIYLQEGKSKVTADNREFLLQAGEIFLAFPNQIHFYQDVEPVKGWMIIFSPELLPELKKILRMKIPQNPVIRESQLGMDVTDAMNWIEKKLTTGNALDEIIAKSRLLSLVGEMLLYMELTEKAGDVDTAKRILGYCLEHYMEPLTLEYLAKELYLNKYYISHVFRERMNIGYKDFINQLRLEHACEMIKEGVNITEAAYTCGFSSIRTFNRVFVRQFGMTPREYGKKEMRT